MWLENDFAASYREWVRTLKCIINVAAALVLLAGAAHADDARTLWKQGTTAYALGHYDEAATAYEKAYALHPDSALLYNAAQAHRLAGNKSRALLLYQSYLRLYERAPNRDEVQKFVTQLKAAIASEHDAATSPPTATAPGEPPPSTTGTTPTNTTPNVAASPSTATAPATSGALTAAPPERPNRRRNVIIGVTVGVIAVVAIGLGVGLGIGLSKPARDPAPSYGAFSW